LRVSKTKAKRLKPGDEVVVRVARVMGMQGRKPSDGSAALMKVEYDDGSTEVIREDHVVEVLRRS
jgi:hypothetical protein